MSRILLCYVALLSSFFTMATMLPAQITLPQKVQQPSKYSTFQSLEKIIGKDTLPYRLQAPIAIAQGQKYPLVIALHGSGERGNDNERTLTWFAPLASDTLRVQYPAFVLVPQCPKGKRWVEVDWALPAHTMPAEPSVPMRILLALLEELPENLPIDRSRIYLTGLSMGGFGTFDLLARKPDVFACGVPVCGGADTATADRIKHIPLWIFHGGLDKVVIPARSRDMVNALRLAGALPQYTEYPDVEHGSWKPTYANPDLWRWIFAQRKR
jgi:predicted peptidase